MPTPKQTLSFLLRRFREAGIRPHSNLGQNFLIDLNLQHLLLDAAALGPEDVVLEIGTGTGGLTMLLAPRAAAIVTVEVDQDLFQLAAEELDGLPNLTMLCADALRTKNRMNPEVLEAVYAQLDAAPGRHFKLVANLPFNVATPILATLLALDRPPETMTATIQKEVADRIVARPGSKTYGALAIWIQSQCRTEVVRVLGPSVFWPRPKVSSAFLHITLEEDRRRAIPDLAGFHGFVRKMFMHRRKLLRSELLADFKDLGKTQVDGLLAALGFAPTVRAEQISPEQMLALCAAVGQARTAAHPR
ncbi:MAG: 16S rRNA (adenine(1518)-N(6)/adenine(1519)-N(6))-dimethyltransferase RsmA [Thermoguttaceae bacterium]|jgi:16S rRNA (adenine1518-N6/adenine1519-N6)-dimethyltransferase